MSSMIERLVGSTDAEVPVERVRVERHYFPQNPRELFDALMPLGGGASLPGLLRTLDYSGTSPRTTLAGLLDRWPGSAELRAVPEPYDPRTHLAEVITGAEFRASLAQRLLSAYPDKRRILFVRVPHSAGSSFLGLAGTIHPIFPERLTWPRAPRDYLGTLGDFVARLATTRTVMIVLPELAPFWRAELPPAAVEGGEAMPWMLPDVPYRPSDRLFTIVRDPEDTILGRVNRITAALAGPAEADDPVMRRWRSRFEAGLAACAPDDLRPLARRILAVFPDGDPLCHALGDGTCAGALDACARTDIEIADFDRFEEWLAKTWDRKPQERHSRARPPVLGRADLARRDLERLAALTEQDRPLYARFKAARESSEMPFVKGSRLGPTGGGAKLLASPGGAP